MRSVDFYFPANKENPIELILFCNLSDRMKAYITRRLSERILEKLSNGMLNMHDVDYEVHRLFRVYCNEKCLRSPRLDDYMLYVRGDVIPLGKA